MNKPKMLLLKNLINILIGIRSSTILQTKISQRLVGK